MVDARKYFLAIHHFVINGHQFLTEVLQKLKVLNWFYQEIDDNMNAITTVWSFTGYSRLLKILGNQI